MYLLKYQVNGFGALYSMQFGFPGKVKFPIYPMTLLSVATRVSFDQLSVLNYLKDVLYSMLGPDLVGLTVAV